MKRYRESLSPEKNQILCNNADAQKKTASPYLLRKRSKFYELMLTHIKKRESLSPEDKDLFVKNNVAAQQKHRKSLSPDQKAQVLTINAAEHKKHQESLSPKQKLK